MANPLTSITTGLSGAASPSRQAQDIIGVGRVGGEPESVEDAYQRAVQEALGARQRGTEGLLFSQQAERIRQAGQPSTVATEAARRQAILGGQATMGAARSQGGVAGTQTAALGALGAGQAQQYGYQAAAQVAAQEQQRNALAQAQMADLLRQQTLAQYGLERADLATTLGAGRALLAPEVESQSRYGLEEARRQQQLYGGLWQAAGSGAGYLLGGR